MEKAATIPNNFRNFNLSLHETIGMRILHTGDWHLGKRLDFFSRLDEQRDVLNEICEIADREQVDAVIVAGDLFDTFNPPVEAIELLYTTLKRLTKDGERPVIAIAGNHDSPDRIDAPDPLARACGILFVGYPNAEIRATNLDTKFTVSKTDKGFIEIQLPNHTYPLRILVTPFANELRLRQYLGLDDREEQLNQMLATHWELLANQYCDAQGVNVLATHLYMLKRGGEILEEPEGEKPIKIGNADLIYSDFIPDHIQYTALGHLHRFHDIRPGSNNPVVYSGSPLSYSFSEAGQQKYIMIVDVQPGEQASYRPVALYGGRVLVRKKFDDVTKCVQWLQEHPNTLVELTLVSDSFLTSAELKGILDAHDGIIHVIPVVKNRPEYTEKTTVDLEKDVNSLFNDFFKSRHGQTPNAEITDLFNEILAHTPENNT